MQLTDLVAILRRHRIVAILTFVLVAGASAVVTVVPRPTYTSTVKVLVVPQSAAAGSDVQVLQFVVSALPAIAESTDFRDRVAGLVATPLRRAAVTIKATSDQTTGQLALTVSSKDRAAVVSWADAAASEIVGPGGGPVTRIADLLVLGPASSPSSSAGTALYVLLGGLLLGLAGAVLVPVWLDRFRDRTQVVEYLPRRFGVPVLGSVPTVPVGLDGARPFRGADPGLQAHFDVIRLTLQVALAGAPVRCLTVLALDAGEGASAVSQLLARSFQLSGVTATVVADDVPQAEIARLADAFATGDGDAPLQLVAQPHAVRGAPGGGEDLPAPAGPADVAPALPARLQGAVILDGPPVSSGAAAAAAALTTGTVVLVVDVRRHTLREVSRSLATLQQLGVRVAGLVLNHARSDPRLARRRFRSPSPSGPPERTAGRPGQAPRPRRKPGRPARPRRRVSARRAS